MTNFDYWNDYWVNDGKAGEVFVDVNGNKPDYLKHHWQTFFNMLEGDCTIVDLGCGGGSIFSAIDVARKQSFRLVGVDLSSEALEITSRNIADVETVRMSSSKTLFNNHSIDVLVSQFGIEYAGLAGFEEAARILSKRGVAKFLCHHKEGYIDQRNKQFLNGAEIAVELSFIPFARELVNALFDGDQEEIDTAVSAFTIAKEGLQQEVATNKDGIHAHLYHGFMTLYEKYRSYHKHDILNWLEAMEADINKNIAKVSAIRNVSLDEHDISQIKTKFRQSGFSKVNIELLQSQKSQDLPVAWDITVSN